MDFFGIGTAMKGLLATYFRGARQTGRTTQMLDALKDGSMVIVHQHSHGERIVRACKERGLDVKVRVLNPRRIHLDFPPVHGRCFFDHVWVEEYYKMAIEDATKAIDELQSRLGQSPLPDSPMLARNEALWRLS